MACAHEGKYELAKRLVHTAARARADAIQFQIFHPQEYIHPDDPDYGFIKKIALLPDQWIKLFECAKNNKLEVITVACDRMSIDLAESQNTAGYKVHSADLNNSYITKYIAKLRKPIMLSIGGSYLSEIESGIKDIQSCGNRNIILMYGIQNFPTLLSSVNLNSILELERKFNFPVGYQDHTDGSSPWSFWLPIMSLSLGAIVLEKHITYDRSKKGIDYQAALNPDEFCEFVKIVRTAEKILGQTKIDKFYNLDKETRKYRTYSKMRNVVTDRLIRKGGIIKEKDIKVLRFRNGKIPAVALPSIIGKKTRKELPRFYAIDWKDLR